MQKLLTKREVADILRISIPTLDRRRARGEIREIYLEEEKHAGPGRRLVRFEEQEVSRYIRAHQYVNVNCSLS